MPAVFSHGRLRLYLLKLLAEGPRHGYELIRLLENRFLGLYAPSAGTIYPRLQRLEAEGLVNHAAAGGRKVYQITDAGRQELSQRAGELVELEREIHASVVDLTAQARTPRRPAWAPSPPPAAVELERAAGQLAAEVRRLVRQPGLDPTQLQAVTTMVTGALGELRRLLES